MLRVASWNVDPQPLSAPRGCAMVAMTPVKHFKTGRLGFLLHRDGEWARIYFPDTNRSDWRRAIAIISIPHEELKAIQ